MANYAYSPRGFEPTALETTFANQMSGPNANQLIGYLYSARMRGEQGNKEYQDTMLQTQAMANESAREKMKYDLAAALAKTPESLMLTNPGRSIAAPQAADLLTDYSFTGLDRERASAFKDFGAGVRDFSHAGVAPPMGSGYSLSGRPTEQMTQGTPLPIQLKGSGSGASSNLAEAKLTLAEQKVLADNMRQYDMATERANAQYTKDVQAIAKANQFNPKAREAAIAARQAEHAATMQRIEAGKQTTLASIGRKAATPQTAAPTPTSTQTSTSATTDVDRELTNARNALARNAPRAEVEKILRSRGVDPALLNAR